MRGKVALLELLDVLSPLEQRCRSEAESRYLEITRRAGIPPTTMNHPVTDATGRRRYIDAVHLPERVPVEIDSVTFHGTLLDRHDDLERERSIVLVGWRSFLRFTTTDVFERPGLVVATVRAALDAARRTPPPTPVE